MWLPFLSAIALVAPALTLRTLEPVPPVSISRSDPVEGWVDVRLNHYMASDTRTFPMRYYYNSEFAYSNNIVIFVGGEWAISPGWTTGGLPYELAKATDAAIFYTEHRYYGNTRPLPDTSVDNLRFLTIDQALADLAQFIQHVKSDDFEGGKYRNGNVSLVGCSYAGTMATWMRLQYPHLVTASFSDSGPLHAQEDFPEYLEVITEALRTQGGEQCVSSISDAMDQLLQRLTTPSGPTVISNTFGTCSTIATTPLDLATFFWFGITESFAYLVQYAVPGDIAEVCEGLTNENIEDPVLRLANFVTSLSWNLPCIETRYTEVVNSHRDTNYNARDAVMRLWTYQTCVEFGWYQTTTSSHQPFLSTVPLEYFHQMCKDFFSIDFDEANLRAGIERTNLFFGGLTHIPDRVVSVAGSHDPWSPMGPNATHAHHNAPVFVVPQVSHCQAIRPTGSSEDVQLEATKQRVLELMFEWSTGYPGMASGSSVLQANVVVLILAVLLWN